jgi:hypothetical protein
VRVERAGFVTPLGQRSSALAAISSAMKSPISARISSRNLSAGACHGRTFRFSALALLAFAALSLTALAAISATLTLAAVQAN